MKYLVRNSLGQLFQDPTKSQHSWLAPVKGSAEAEINAKRFDKESAQNIVWAFSSADGPAQIVPDVNPVSLAAAIYATVCDLLGEMDKSDRQDIALKTEKTFKAALDEWIRFQQ